MRNKVFYSILMTFTFLAFLPASNVGWKIRKSTMTREGNNEGSYDIMETSTKLRTQ
jgi:hypothetical protein